jgi:hypothetical protein
MTRPIPFQWDGEVMRPTRGFARLADLEYVVGEVYTLDQVADMRSMRSHRHYFQAVYDAWLNLGPMDAERFPTEVHLRKYALIRGSYCDSREYVAGSKAEAVRLAAFIKPMDTYALVAVNAPVVRVYTARSQDTRSMGRKVFQESKDAVLKVLSEMMEGNREGSLFEGQGRGGSNAAPVAA